VAIKKYPVIYSSDLFHPHRDPDDHFDLATLFSLPELNILGIVLDQGGRQDGEPGIIPVEQMMQITQRKVPYAAGLDYPLKTPEDKGFEQSKNSQKAIDMILESLTNSSEKVTIFTAGSLRDIAAAFNRDPFLFKEKVRRLYINIGHYGITGKDDKDFTEYNVEIDPQAFITIMRSGLSIYWCPCFGKEHGTFWKFQQKEVLDTASLPVQNYFIFALTRRKGVDPIAALSMPLNPVEKKRIWEGYRNMWCTAPLIHASGRKIYKLNNGRYSALAEPPMNGQEVKLFEFIPVMVSVDNNCRTKVSFVKEKANMHLFHLCNKEIYGRALTSCLQELFKGLGK